MLEKIFGVAFGKNDESKCLPAVSADSRQVNVYIPSEFSSFQEEIMFNSAFRATLCKLEQKLHDYEDTQKIILHTVKTGCLFYDADWCGILIADRNTGVWSAKFWYDRAADGMAPSLIRENEFFEYFPRWVEALNNGEPIVIPDVEAIRDVYTDEYEGYKRLEVRNVIGAPFGENPTGFLVVKNARRYRTYPDMMQMLAFVSLSQYYLGEFINSTPEEETEAKKVRINLFGSPSISYRGSVTGMNDYRAPKGWRLLVYLTISEKPKSAYEIASALWPDDTDNQSENVRGLVYRLRDKLAQRIPKDLIINENNRGYRMNPDLVLVTDAAEMESLWEKAQTDQDVFDKVNDLKQAMNLYTGEIFQSCADEAWLNGYANHYAILYVNIVNLLLNTLAGENDYPCIQEYASKSLKLASGNKNAYYWLTVALLKSGAVKEAKQRIITAKSNLISEDYSDLIVHLKEKFPVLF